MFDKSKVIDAAKSEMDSLHAKLGSLKVQASLAKTELKNTVQPEIEKLDLEMKKAEKQFTELLHSSGEASKDLKHGMDIALKSISASVKKASKHFK